MNTISEEQEQALIMNGEAVAKIITKAFNLQKRHPDKTIQELANMVFIEYQKEHGMNK
jgi:hypothetical protein